MKHIEHASAASSAGAFMARGALLHEAAHAEGHYVAECWGPVEDRRSEYVGLQARIKDETERMRGMHMLHTRTMQARLIRGLRLQLDSIPVELKWNDTIENAVVAEGKNYVLDKAFAGSSYTAAWYVGIYNSGYTVTGSETYASKGATENTNYSNSTRVAPSWSAASAGAKAFSAAAVFNINGAGGTIAGCFLVTVSTKGDSTSGASNVMWSIGAFSGGNKTVASGDTLNVSYSTSL